MRILWIFLAVQTLNLAPTLAEAGKSARNCCSNEHNVINNNICVPDVGGNVSQVVLKCKSKYVLDPSEIEEDTYDVTANGSLYVHDLKRVIPPDEFCLVNQQGSEINDKSHEIAIVCFVETPSELSLSKLTFTVKALLILISVLFLLLTLYVYFLLPELRETQDKVTIFTLINLTTFLTFLGIMQVQTPIDIIMESCVGMAFIVYFFTMGYFAWLNCVIANVWKTVVLRQWKIQERYWYLVNHLYGWSLPCILTTVVAVRHLIKPSLGVSTCWFHNDNDQWILVYLPISIMLAVNVFLCIWTCLCLINNDFTPDARKALRYKCILYIKLFLLGGFTWIFEVLSYVFNDHAPSAWLWMIVDFFNCLHGILVFFVLVIWRQRIRRELAGSRVLCVYCPSKWADEDDEEAICLESEGKGKYDLIIKTLK